MMVTGNLEFKPGSGGARAPVERDDLEACYEERRQFALLAPSPTKELHVGGTAYTEKEDWVISPVWTGDLEKASYPTVPPDTRYYDLQPPVVDDKTGLLQGERVIQVWRDLDGRRIKTNLGNYYVLRDSLSPNARWERE